MADNIFVAVQLTGSVPKIAKDHGSQVWHGQQIEDARIDAGRDAGLTVAEIIFKGSSTHSTLCKRSDRGKREYET